MTIAEALRAEGREQGREETAKRMLSNNFDIHLIALATSLSIERIMELKHNLVSLN